ncbi:MAG TPA: MarR family transcriptional regulator [Kineosporiaceae bacterium]
MAQRGYPDGSGPSLLYAVKQVELAVRRHLDDLLRPSGVTTVQYTALTVLERCPGLSSAELARASFVTAQSMADVVSALEVAGLVARQRDDANRRRLVLDLTPAGKDLLARLAPAVVQLERLMVSGLDDAEVQQLGRGLASCRAALGRDE